MLYTHCFTPTSPCHSDYNLLRHPLRKTFFFFLSKGFKELNPPPGGPPACRPRHRSLLWARAAPAGKPPQICPPAPGRACNPSSRCSRCTSPGGGGGAGPHPPAAHSPAARGPAAHCSWPCTRQLRRGAGRCRHTSPRRTSRPSTPERKHRSSDTCRYRRLMIVKAQIHCQRPPPKPCSAGLCEGLCLFQATRTRPPKRRTSRLGKHLQVQVTGAGAGLLLRARPQPSAVPRRRRPDTSSVLGVSTKLQEPHDGAKTKKPGVRVSE